MFSASLSRSSRQLWAATAARRVSTLLSGSAAGPKTTNTTTRALRNRVLLDSSRVSRVCYSTTPVLFRKLESHQEHVNINKSSTPGAASASSHTSDEEDKDQHNMVTDDDDLMVGNEGLETIDPKDFPDLYPGEENIEGLSQESHPDNERDFEGVESTSQSVLLSDKERSEQEFSWFVDESYPDKAAQGGQHDSLSSDFVPLWQKNAQQLPGDLVTDANADDQKVGEVVVGHSADSIAELVKLIESERGRNVKVIDMRDKCDWTDWMVIAEGLSERHLGNVADEVYTALKKSSPRTSPPMMEGRDTSDWVVIDAGSVVIHFMTPEARKERDLEGLWASVKNPLKLKDAEELSWDDVKAKMTKSWKENTGRSKGEDGKRGRRGERDIPLSEVVKW